MSAPRAKALDVHRAFDGVAAAWEDLAESVGASPFLRPGWAAAWWRAFGRGRLEIVTLRRDGRLRAVMPLRRGGGSLSSITNWHTPVFGPVAEDDAATAELIGALLARRPSRLVLSFVDGDDSTLTALTGAAAEAGYRVRSRPRMKSPYVALPSEPEECDRLLTGKRRREVRRRWRLLAERGDLRLDVQEAPEPLQPALEEGFAVEALGWKGSRGTAITSSPSTARFYSDVAAWAGERGWLRLCFLRLGDSALAFDLALEHGGRHYLLKTGYDPAYRAESPGVLLRWQAIRRAAALGLDTYEFLGHVERTKLDWTETCRERLHAEAFRRSPSGSLRWLVFGPGRDLAARLRAQVRR